MMLKGRFTMTEAFNKLPEEKKKHIIKVCIKEFGENGYDKTSTNSIVAKAGIGKGMLFHYFGSKKQLFFYLLNYCMDIIISSIDDKLDEIECDDFFVRVKKILLIKLIISSKYEDEYKLIVKAFSVIPVELSEKLKTIQLKYLRDMQEMNKKYLYSYLNTENLREDIHYEKIIEMLKLFFDGLAQKYMFVYKNRESEFLKDGNKLSDELDEYFDVIKHGIYKYKMDSSY